MTKSVPPPKAWWYVHACARARALERVRLHARARGGAHLGRVAGAGDASVGHDVPAHAWLGVGGRVRVGNRARARARLRGRAKIGASAGLG